jgi:S-adenosylmethionine decarboxylase
MAFGTHVISELSECKNIHYYDNLKNLKRMMQDCVKQAGLTCLKVHAHKFEPQGISGVAILQESHLSAHIWPEKRYVALDVYTCGIENESRAYKAAEIFAESMGARVVKQYSKHRGLLNSKCGLYEAKDVENL